MKTEGEEVRDSGGGQAPFLKPKLAEIAELIANDGAIHSGETKSQRAAADNAKLYTKIEKDLHGNKDAAKAVRRLVKMDQSHRDDFLRTFEGLCDYLKLWPPEDLVDAAQGKGEVLLTGGDRGRVAAVVQQAGVDYDPDDDDDNVGGTVADVVPDTPAAGEDDDIADNAGEAQAAPPTNITPFQSALDKSRSHLGSAEPSAPPKGRRKPPTGESRGPAVH